ncbi:MAG: hypothetical protein HZC54_08555 [Verrucomicrobia bacterium]|nr:hypothetical protein [Verrucomicrobiota bacterium]
MKKHYEKIALAIVSMMMIATAVILVDRLGLEETPARRIDTNIAAATPLDTNELLQVATLLKNPLAWRTNDGPRPFIPDVWKWNGTDFYRAGDEPTTKTNVVTDPAEDLNWWVASRTFPVKFMSVASEVGTNKVFAINLPGAGTRFVKIGDPPIRQPIYGIMEEFIVLRYDEKKVKWFNPAIGGETVSDVSVLTLQRRSAGVVKEIPLVVGKQVLESEPVARYQSSVTGEQSGELKQGSKFNYKGRAYELVRLDSNLPLLIFKDIQTQKEYKRRPRVVQKF